MRVVFGTRHTVLWIRIGVFLDLPDPDLSLFVRIGILPLSRKKIRKILIHTSFFLSDYGTL
jgi:hypothetical protein